MTQGSALRILIVGAGLGGLTAAIALRQAGHIVEVYEKSRLANEIGAAVVLNPNCTAALQHIGLNPENFGATFARQILSTKGAHTLEPRYIYPMNRQEPGKPKLANGYFAHRVDLHNALKQKAIDENGSGVPVILHKGSPIASVDCNTATIMLADGRTVTGDIVIGADGVHSKVRQSMLGDGLIPYAERPSGMGCFRFLLPVEELRADPETSFLVEDSGCLIEIPGKTSRIVLYPCSNGKIMNCAALTSRENVGFQENGEVENISRKERLLKTFENFAPALVRLLEKTEEEKLTVWELLDMDVLPVYTKGKVTLMGDAAHPFLPWLGQGATQAIEDGIAIANMLPLGTTIDQIPKRLQMFEACRKPRAERVQQLTRWKGRPESGEQGPPVTPEEVAQFWDYTNTHDEYVYSKKFFELFH